MYDSDKRLRQNAWTICGGRKTNELCLKTKDVGYGYVYMRNPNIKIG